MRAGQYASGLSSRTGTRSHIFSAESKLLYSCHKNHISMRLIEKYFPIQVVSLRARDSPEAPFSLVSHDTFSHLHLRQMRRQGTRKKTCATYVHCRAQDNGNCPQTKSYHNINYKHTQIHKLKYRLQRRCVPALVGP